MNNNVMIIGGGPAGLEAAAQLQRMGYNVILVEKEERIGGHLAKWNRLFPSGEEAGKVLKELEKKIQGVKCFVNTDVQSINRLEQEYNVILSNGITVLSKAVLITTGFDIFKAEKKEEYGYGIYDKVITNADLENYFNTGKDSRIINNPRRIGFVHCVGSRDEKAGNRYCSKVCCATAVKQACEIKEKFPAAEIFCFYMDLRMFGRGFEDMYLSAQKEYGIRFIRGRVSEVSENIDGMLIVKAEDTLSGKPIKVSLDLLVLMAGMENSRCGMRVGEMLGLEKSESDNFFLPAEGIVSQHTSNRGGIFYAGACTGPKTLPETLHEARSAATAIDEYVKAMEE